MGGSNAWMQLFGGEANQQPVSPPQYNNDQLLKYAQDQHGNYGQFDKYKAEVANQLRSGSYKDPYGVWQAVRNNQFTADQSANNELAFPQADSGA